jgi:hypothetical protein
MELLNNALYQQLLQLSSVDKSNCFYQLTIATKIKVRTEVIGTKLIKNRGEK